MLAAKAVVVLVVEQGFRGTAVVVNARLCCVAQKATITAETTPKVVRIMLVYATAALCFEWVRFCQAQDLGSDVAWMRAQTHCFF
jgi:hypothetical protein